MHSSPPLTSYFCHSPEITFVTPNFLAVALHYYACGEYLLLYPYTLSGKKIWIRKFILEHDVMTSPTPSSFACLGVWVGATHVALGVLLVGNKTVWVHFMSGCNFRRITHVPII